MTVAAPRYLLDTNVLSELVKPAGLRDEGVSSRLASLLDVVVTCAPVWHELEFGRQRLPAGRRRRAIDAAIAHLEPALVVLPYDARAARWHAGERARLTRAGRTPPFVDGQIAAIATTNDLVLVSRNARDFAPFEGLRVESWHS